MLQAGTAELLIGRFQLVIGAPVHTFWAQREWFHQAAPAKLGPDLEHPVDRAVQSIRILRCVHQPKATSAPGSPAVQNPSRR